MAAVSGNDTVNPEPLHNALICLKPQEDDLRQAATGTIHAGAGLLAEINIRRDEFVDADYVQMNAAPRPSWEHFPHEADMGVRGFGDTREQAFEQAALAMTAIITDVAKVAAREPVAIQCEAPDPELLFVDWLNAIVYEMATRHMLFSRFEVTIVNTTLSATAWGESLDIKRHQPAVEVKGATMTALRVAQEQGQWIAQTVVDV